MTKEERRRGFLAAIAAGPWDDHDARMVFADWLEENDEPEEALRQRNWVEASRWLRDNIVPCFDSEPDWNGVVMDYDGLIEAGRRFVEHNEYTSERGSQSWQDAIYHRNLEFWENWSIVTGTHVPEEVRRSHGPFCCGC